ncbi:MAG TPA: CBS domain-containing protein [Thermoanaerobaculia bacterium]|jgi:CBS domain-containing protein
MGKLMVRDLMTEDVIALGPEDNLAKLRDLLYERGIRHMPIIDGDGQLVGLVSQRDLLRNSLVDQVNVPAAVEQAVLERLQVRDVMTSGVVGVRPDLDIREAAQLMLEHQYGCLPVVDGEGRLVGILTESDFVRLLARGN